MCCISTSTILRTSNFIIPWDELSILYSDLIQRKFPEAINGSGLLISASTYSYKRDVLSIKIIYLFISKVIEGHPDCSSLNV